MANNFNICDKPVTNPVTSVPSSAMSNINSVRFLGVLNHSGSPVSADGTFLLDDVVWDSNGVLYMCTAGGTPGTWVAPGRAGQSLGRATSTAQDSIGTTEADLVAMTISFTVPSDRDVWVFGRVAMCGAGTASAILTLKLTDETVTTSPSSGAGVKDVNSERSGTASRNHITLSVDEVIPAGSGTVTRKLRAICSTADGYTNLASSGRNTLEAFIR